MQGKEEIMEQSVVKLREGNDVHCYTGDDSPGSQLGLRKTLSGGAYGTRSRSDVETVEHQLVRI